MTGVTILVNACPNCCICMVGNGESKCLKKLQKYNLQLILRHLLHVAVQLVVDLEQTT